MTSESPLILHTKPTHELYYMGIAIAVSARAECCSKKVGAVLVRDHRVLSTGYNGTPEGWPNCQADTAVCPRCDNKEQYEERHGKGHGFDQCICVHAEANAVTGAARHGTAIGGSTAYVTHEPCLTCYKELVQSGVAQVWYLIEGGDPEAESTEVETSLVHARAKFRTDLSAQPMKTLTVAGHLRGATNDLQAYAQRKGQLGLERATDSDDDLEAVRWDIDEVDQRTY